MGAFSFRSSFQRRIILLVGWWMLLLVVALGISGQVAVNTSIDRVLQERLVLAQTTGDYLQYILDQNMARLEGATLARGIDIGDLDLEPEKVALHDAFLGSIFERLYITDESGHVKWAEPNLPAFVGKEIYSRPSVRDVLLSEKPLVSGAYTDEDGRRIVSGIVPVRDGQGDVVGTVGGDIDLAGASLQQVVQPVSLGKTGYVEVVDDRGIVLAGSNTSHLLTESDHGNTLSNLIRNKEPVVSTCHGGCHAVGEGVAREKEVMAFAPLPRVAWGVTIRQTEQEALAPSRSLRQRFWLFSGFLWALSLAMAWGVGRSLAKPIRELTTAAQRISSGNLTDPIPPFGQDEIGELGQSLDTMRVRLGAYMEEIQGWNRDLEARVQERTEQLEASNRELLVLNSMASVVSQSLDLEVMIQQALDKLLEVFEAESGWVRLLGEGTSELVLAGQRGLKSEPQGKGAEWTEQVAKAVDTAMQSGGPVFWGGSPAQTGGGGRISLVCIPLRARERVLGVIGIEGALGGWFGGEGTRLLESIGRQMGVAVENAALYKELEHKEAMRGEMLRKVISAQEEERKRIARELHDETSQDLAVLMMTLDTVATSGNATAYPKFEAMKEMAIRALDGIHQMIFDLRPSVLDDLGLLPAIRWYAGSRLKNTGVKVHLEVDGEEKRLPPQTETALFRVVQEAITNIAKHARAENVMINIEFKPESVVIELEDDGEGFDLPQVIAAGDKARGLGLIGMQERVELLGGKIVIDSAPATGTRLFVEVPFREERRADV